MLMMMIMIVIVMLIIVKRIMMMMKRIPLSSSCHLSCLSTGSNMNSSAIVEDNFIAQMIAHNDSNSCRHCHHGDDSNHHHDDSRKRSFDGVGEYKPRGTYVDDNAMRPIDSFTLYLYI